MDDEILSGSRAFLVKLGTQLLPGSLSEIQYVVDVNTGEHRPAHRLEKNEIARCVVELSRPIPADTFDRHRTVGELILIDRLTNATSACGVVQKVFRSQEKGDREITPALRAKRLGQTPFVILADSLQAAGEIENALLSRSLHTLTVRERGENLLFAVDLLRQAGLISVLAGDSLDEKTEQKLRVALQGGPLVDLRAGGPAEDRALYENMVNYAFY